MGFTTRRRRLIAVTKKQSAISKTALRAIEKHQLDPALIAVNGKGRITMKEVNAYLNSQEQKNTTADQNDDHDQNTIANDQEDPPAGQVSESLATTATGETS